MHKPVKSVKEIIESRIGMFYIEPPYFMDREVKKKIAKAGGRYYRNKILWHENMLVSLETLIKICREGQPPNENTYLTLKQRKLLRKELEERSKNAETQSSAL